VERVISRQRYQIRLGRPEYTRERHGGQQPAQPTIRNTISDFGQFGPVNSGVYLLTNRRRPTPHDDLIRLRNLYDGVSRRMTGRSHST